MDTIVAVSFSSLDPDTLMFDFVFQPVLFLCLSGPPPPPPPAAIPPPPPPGVPGAPPPPGMGLGAIPMKKKNVPKSKIALKSYNWTKIPTVSIFTSVIDRD